MKHSYIFTTLLCGVLVSISFASQACAAETGTIVENLHLRSGSSTQTKVLATIPKGGIVNILHKQDQWYKVEVNGEQGWMFSQYIHLHTSTASSSTLLENRSEQIQTFSTLLYNSHIRKNPAIADNILFTVPQNSRVGIISKEGEWYKVKTELGVEGYIFGELIKTTISDNVKNKIEDNFSKQAQKDIPTDVDIAQLNSYWLKKVNTIRKEKGLRELVIDDRWNITATDWSQHMAQVGYATHTRPDGKSMHQWIDTKGLNFTDRYSENGWKTNYFTENIAWGISSGTMDGVKGVLDDTMRFFLSEGASGAHYRTLYHPDWNSMGVGYAFVSQGNGKYKVYVTFHYGSLKP